MDHCSHVAEYYLEAYKHTVTKTSRVGSEQVWSIYVKYAKAKCERWLPL